jgi:hypothetical protein
MDKPKEATMARTMSLDLMEVQHPCPADWDAMTPAASSARHCEHCHRHVHDLSQLTRAQAEDLLCASAERLCVRFSRDEAGQVRTLDYAPRDPRQRRRWRLLAILLAGFSTASGSAAWRAGLLGKFFPKAVTGSTATAVMGRRAVMGNVIPVNRTPSSAASTPMMGAVKMGSLAPISPTPSRRPSSCVPPPIVSSASNQLAGGGSDVER